MSVLVEALTLVVRKQVLDLSYPGGTAAFLTAALELPNPPRFICSADPDLVNLSFYNPDHIEPATSLLEDAGLVALDEGQFYEFACIEQDYGPTMPCSWLEWGRDERGFTVAWLPDSDLSAGMAAPEDWTPECSMDLTREDLRDRPDMMLLSSKDGVETWLDLGTGRIHDGPAGREVPPPQVRIL